MVSYNKASFSWQTISYMAERVVGHGSFGIVFQASFTCPFSSKSLLSASYIFILFLIIINIYLEIMPNP